MKWLFIEKIHRKYKINIIQGFLFYKVSLLSEKIKFEGFFKYGISGNMRIIEKCKVKFYFKF